MTRDRVLDALLDGLKAALAASAEQRLYRSGKLDGLFAGKTGVNGDAASRAVRDGLLEVVRLETRGKSSFEWVRLTPQGIAYLRDNESPLRALEDLRDLLKMNRESLSPWLEQMRQGMQALATGLEQQARGWTEKLEGLQHRVEEALSRLEKKRPALPDEVVERVPWASAALEYLDRRAEAGAAPTCAMPELFGALSEGREDLSVTSFHEGLRLLHERRALRLLPLEDAADCPQPEFALFDAGRVLYRIAI